jgi:hypothetical protein
VKFAQQVGSPAAKRPAPRTFLLRPEHFAETWDKEKRPTVPVEIGLRVPSAAAGENAEIEADKLAEEAPERERERVKRGHLIAFLVSRGMCSVHDVTQPHPLFELAEDVIPQAFKPDTIRRIFDEVERLAIDESAAFPEATADELRELAGYLEMDDPFSGLSQVQRSQAARYVRFVLDLIREPDGG